MTIFSCEEKKKLLVFPIPGKKLMGGEIYLHRRMASEKEAWLEDEY